MEDDNRREKEFYTASGELSWAGDRRWNGGVIGGDDELGDAAQEEGAEADRFTANDSGVEVEVEVVGDREEGDFEVAVGLFGPRIKLRTSSRKSRSSRNS